MTAELIGSFNFWQDADRRWRQWHVFVALDEKGQLDHIYLSNSELLTMAQGPLSKHDCTTPLYRRAWHHAITATKNVKLSTPADDAVIDLFDDHT